MGLIIKDKVQYGNKSGTVRFDQAQGLTAAQQAQARDNIGAQDTTYQDATQLVSGLMSATDKAKLDNVYDRRFKIINLGNADEIVIDTGFIPTPSNYGHCFWFNANQPTVAMAKLDAAEHLYVTVLYSDPNSNNPVTYPSEIVRNGGVYTITPSTKLWGVTTVFYMRN